MQGTACTTAGSYGEVLLALLYALLLVGTCNGVLESGRVGGVTSDGNINAFLPHDCYALGNVVCAVAVNLSTQTGGVCLAEYFLNLAGVVIHLGLNICKAVDSGDDLCSVLAKTVQDNAERFLTNLVCLLCDTDSALSSRKGLVTCQEAEALCLFLEQHLAEVAVTETNLTLISNRTRNAECLEAFADCSGSVGSSGAVLLDSDSAAYCVSPLSVLEADGLDLLNFMIDVKTLCLADVGTFLDGVDAVVLQNSKDLGFASVVGFK